jgi:hypothetical protein
MFEILTAWVPFVSFHGHASRMAEPTAIQTPICH